MMVELEQYINLATDSKKKVFDEAFTPHQDALFKWHKECKGQRPQPHEIVLFDIAAQAAVTVHWHLEAERKKQ